MHPASQDLLKEARTTPRICRTILRINFLPGWLADPGDVVIYYARRKLHESC
jgi:hypothetical protein